MGKNKSKMPEAPVQSGIFNTLFGGAQVENTDFSFLFSENNPFRRKPTEPNFGETAQKVEFPDSDGKRDEEEATVSTVSTKRSKKDKAQKPNLGSDTNGGSNDDVDGNTKLGLELDASSKRENVSDFDSEVGSPQGSDKKTRKKRNRDEIEKEYEEKKYGAVPEEEEENKKKVGEKRKKVDVLTDAMVSKEGFDDENKLLRTVFIGNLPLKVKKKAILKEFSKFGEVESVRIRSVPIIDTKKTRKGAIMQKQINENASSCHAYVVFETEQSAEAALAHNMSLIGGNHIRVDKACPPRKKLKGQSAPLYDPKRTVFVGNLPFDVKDEELYQLFTSINNLEGSVEGIRVIRDPHVNVGKGIAYVLFKTREAVNLVIRKGILKLRDRELRLSRTKPDSTQSKRKLPSSSADAYSPAKKLATGKFTSSAGKENITLSGKASLSYQGLRATKSDSNRKKLHQKSPGSVKMKPKGVKKEEKPNDRKQKRPAVSARKAKAKAMKESGMKQAGTKRKQDNRTVESFRQKKKAKRF